MTHRTAILCSVLMSGLTAVASPAYGQAAASAPAGEATIARLQYEGGGDWYANPSSLPNLLRAISERTALKVADRERVVTISSEQLWSEPYLYMTGHGNVHFSDSDLERLRTWLNQGGFLHVDDNYGMDQSIRRELARLLPERELVDVPVDHPIYHLVYDFPQGIPKVHEHDGKPAQGLGLFIDGRLAVYYTYETDLGDGWEDPEVHDDPPAKREEALRMGVNLYSYAVGYGG